METRMQILISAGAEVWQGVLILGGGWVRSAPERIGVRNWFGLYIISPTIAEVEALSESEFNAFVAQVREERARHPA